MRKKIFYSPSPHFNLKLTMLESIITSGLMSVPFMSLFWGSTIGLTQGEIGLTQAIYSIVMILLDFPMGFIADKLSRKWCNIIGDFGMALTFIFYANTNSLGGVVCGECLFGNFCLTQ